MSSTDLIFGKYQIVRRLALGGMGEVFLARQTGVAGFDRLVILKSLLPELAAQEGFVDQFLDEARVAATLNHPNIVQIFEVGLWQGVYFIAMEYIRGENLARINNATAKRGARVPIAAAVRVIHDAALGLDSAHTARDVHGQPLHIVHRDVSPQNIMVRGDGVTKVVDFGIAKASNRATRTATGTLKGKLQYMAPEQVENKQLDGRTDQFSLGVVLWELCCGRRLFAGENEIDTIKRVLAMPVPPPSTVVPGFPRDLEQVIMRMLDRDVNRRYPRLADAARDLKAWLDAASKGFGEAEMAAFVQAVVGADLDEQTRDIKPTGENFFISLSGAVQNAGTPTTASTQYQKVPPSKRSVPMVAGAAAALTLFVGAGLFLFVGAREAPAPPAPAPAPIVAPAPPPATMPAPAAPPVVRVESDPEGASLFVGDVAYGKTPAVLDRLAPGMGQELRLSKPGFRPAVVKVEPLAPGEQKTVRVKLERAGGAPSPTPGTTAPERPATGDGWLTLQTVPWTKVSIDGEPHGSTPLFKRKLPAGNHTLVLVNEEAGVNDKRRFSIAPGETTKLNLTLK